MVSLFSIADTLSGSLNPALSLLILEEPLLKQSDSQESWFLFWLRAGAAIGVAVTLAELGKHYQIWPGHPSFPSGHTAFATAASACLVLRRGKRWLFLAVPATGLMGWGLVYGHWHTVSEVIGGFMMAVFAAAACFRIPLQAHRKAQRRG